MTLKEHYRVRKKVNIKLYAIIFIFMAVAISEIYTLSSYSKTSSQGAFISTANWNIYVNGQKITNNTLEVHSATKMTPDNQNETGFAAGDTGYFDIVLNPSGTEVAVEFNINIDLSHMPEGTTITSCEQTVNGLTETIFTGHHTTIEDNVLLRNNRALDNSDIRTFRVHCKIADNAVLDANTDYYVGINIIGQQII